MPIGKAPASEFAQLFRLTKKRGGEESRPESVVQEKLSNRVSLLCSQNHKCRLIKESVCSSNYDER